jgi:hypothetical protein
MSNRGIISFLLVIVFLFVLHFTNPTMDKHLELLKTKFSDEYSAEMGDDNTFASHFAYTNYYFFSITINTASDLHENSSFGILGFVF